MARQVISFHYKVTDDRGGKVDSSEGQAPLTVLEGAGQIIPGLEKALVGLKKGDKKIIAVTAAEAYGERDEARLVKVGRDQIPAEEVKIGDRFRGGDESHSPTFVVTALSETEVSMDGNHPLAGQNLIFDVQVMEIRPATEDELKHGHAHGEGGHGH